MLFEHRSQPLLQRPLFYRRLARSIALGLAIVLVSLLLGMLGYRWLVGLSWIDAFLNAAMILSGMGPVDRPATDAGKLFAGVYALYSGIAVLAVAGVLFAPIVHRLIHRMHADPDTDSKSGSDR
jgi:hypothetical protein